MHVLIAAALLGGCSGPQAARIKRPAELAIGGSLLGVLGSSVVIAAAPQSKPYSTGTAIGFGGLAIISAIVYGVAFANAPPPPPPPPPVEKPDHRPEAWAKTQQAQSHARGGDCDTVKALSAEVAALDGDFHVVVFMRDAAIARCLAGSDQEN
jgi:hypothetical protein